jgi:hypothetical protein
VFVNRDDTRTIKQILLGRSGTGDKDGLVYDVEQVKREVAELRGWKLAIEVAEKAEKEMYQGEERRHHARRLRDVITERHIHTDEHEGER